VAELSFECLDVVAQLYAASPTLLFRLRVSESSGAPVHAIALRAQIRIEPARRRYSDAEAELLVDLFGQRSRWGDTLKPMQLAYADIMVPGFTTSTEIELAVPVTYDLEVASGKYLHALQDEGVALALLFSGTVFGKGDNGFWVQQVPWHAETNYRMPVAVWRELMEHYFPEGGWLRLRRDTLDELMRFKSANTIATWDAVMETLLDRAQRRYLPGGQSGQQRGQAVGRGVQP
jgi:hypothetical protein